ncbi:MAG: phosphotransferase, partial [Chloroflexota bacterium]
IARDIEEILRRLFHANDGDKTAVESITLTPLPFLPDVPPQATSLSSAIVMQVRPQFNDQSFGAPHVLKLGSKIEISEEAAGHRAFVARLESAHHAELKGEAVSRQVGGLTFTLLGAPNDLEQIMVFSQFYQIRSAAQIAGFLKRFFSVTYHNLLKTKRIVARYDLRKDYIDALHLNASKLRKALLDLLGDEAALNRRQLRLPGLEWRPIENPFLWAVLPSGEFTPFLHDQTAVCWGHGDFHSKNLLVDNEGHGWLIDCARAGEGHALRDIVELETDVKFALLSSTDNLEVLLKMEEALLMPTRAGEPLPEFVAASPDAQKAYDVVRCLRAIACDFVGEDRGMQEYYH